MDNSNTVALDAGERERLAAILQKISASDPTSYRLEALRNRSSDREELAAMATLLPPQTTPYFTSHRPFIGPIIVFVKLRIAEFIAPIFRLSITKQSEFNQLVFNLALKVQRLEGRIAELEKELREQP